MSFEVGSTYIAKDVIIHNVLYVPHFKAILKRGIWFLVNIRLVSTSCTQIKIPSKTLFFQSLLLLPQNLPLCFLTYIVTMSLQVVLLHYSIIDLGTCHCIS